MLRTHTLYNSTHNCPISPPRPQSDGDSISEFQNSEPSSSSSSPEKFVPDSEPVLPIKPAMVPAVAPPPALSPDPPPTPQSCRHRPQTKIPVFPGPKGGSKNTQKVDKKSDIKVIKRRLYISEQSDKNERYNIHLRRQKSAINLIL